MSAADEFRVSGDDPPPEMRPTTIAAIALLGRTGTAGLTIRLDDPDPDEGPRAWMALVEHGGHWRAAGGMTVDEAVLRLCEVVIDGAKCVHCGRMAAFDADEVPGPVLGEALVCWVQYDPELRRFRQSCEGNDR